MENITRNQIIEAIESTGTPALGTEFYQTYIKYLNDIKSGMYSVFDKKPVQKYTTLVFSKRNDSIRSVDDVIRLTRTHRARVEDYDKFDAFFDGLGHAMDFIDGNTKSVQDYLRIADLIPPRVYASNEFVKKVAEVYKNLTE